MKIPVFDALQKYGFTSKFVRAICAKNGWKWAPQGAPAEWYDAFAGTLGALIEQYAKENA